MSKVIVVQRTPSIIGYKNADGSHVWPEKRADGSFYNPSVKDFSVKYLEGNEFVVMPPGVSDVRFINMPRQTKDPATAELPLVTSRRRKYAAPQEGADSDDD